MIKAEITYSSKDDKLISSLKTIRFLGMVIYQKRVFYPGLGEYEFVMREIARKSVKIIDDKTCEAMLNVLHGNKVTPS